MADRAQDTVVGEIVKHDDGRVTVLVNSEKSFTTAEFLEYKPSKASRGVMQIKNSKLWTDDEVNLEAVDFEWGDVTSNGEEIPIDPWTIHDMAENHNFKSGFWFFFPRTNKYADFAWEQIYRGMVEEQLGAVSKAECDVSFGARSKSRNQRKYTIRVNNQDYTDEEQVFAIARFLRNAGINCNLKYKADIYNQLVIYQENYYGLRPTIYEIMPNGVKRNYLKDKRLHQASHINEYIMGSNDNGLSLNDWREQYPPSRNSGICRIRVQKYHKMLNYNNMKPMMRSWRQQIWEKLQFFHSTIDNLARDWQMTGGRWYFYVDSNKVDSIWKLVLNGFANGPLDNVAISAEVMPCSSVRHVIKVYNTDYCNVNDVYLLHKLLKEMGVKCKMMYEPIIYSQIGIYRRNPHDHGGLDSIIYKL